MVNLGYNDEWALVTSHLRPERMRRLRTNPASRTRKGSSPARTIYISAKVDTICFTSDLER
eukprot:3806-Eustigmatos_ZCMA.PRE.1